MKLDEIKFYIYSFETLMSDTRGELEDGELHRECN